MLIRIAPFSKGDIMKTSILIGTTRKGETVVIGKPGSHSTLRAKFIKMRSGILRQGKAEIELKRLDLYGLAKSDADKSRRFQSQKAIKAVSDLKEAEKAEPEADKEA